jgi:small subunit ribosomal protein S10
MSKVRIKLKSMNINELNNLINQIKDIASKAGTPISGPIPLPTKKLKITTRKSPCGDGTATFDNFEMRIHARVIDLPADDRVLHAIMRLYIPRSIIIKIEMKE